MVASHEFHPAWLFRFNFTRLGVVFLVLTMLALGLAVYSGGQSQRGEQLMSDQAFVMPPPAAR